MTPDLAMLNLFQHITQRYSVILKQVQDDDCSGVPML
jgi:hypothetical protein